MVYHSLEQPNIEYQQALAKTSLSIPSNVDASLDQQPEIMALKNQIVSLEQNSLLDQEEKEDLEQAMKVVL